MRSFDYKNSVWKSSWYQKQANSAEPVLSGAKSAEGLSALGKTVRAAKPWTWGNKIKPGNAERKK